jgi:hypothetical protein
MSGKLSLLKKSWQVPNRKHLLCRLPESLTAVAAQFRFRSYENVTGSWAIQDAKEHALLRG